MARSQCRMIINRNSIFSDDGKTDCYPHGVIRPEVKFPTFDDYARLIGVAKEFPDKKILKITE